VIFVAAIHPKLALRIQAHLLFRCLIQVELSHPMNLRSGVAPCSTLDEIMSVSSSPNSSNAELCRALAAHIAAQPERRISFADYMDWVLYHPQLGYYSRHAQVIGSQGDFVTSPHLGADFGELLAVQMVQLWQILHRPDPFHVVEMGAGQGLLAQDCLNYLAHHHPDCFQALTYIIIERSPALIAEQRQRLSAIARDGTVQWKTWEDIPPESLVGCCFSNELVDALPVHWVEKRQGLQEVYVTVGDETAAVPTFQEQLGDLSSDRLRTYFDRLGIDLLGAAYPEGYRTEVNLAAQDWLSTVAQRLGRGYVLTIDYGYSAQRYYAPTRSGGTLQCYYRHAHHSDPYRYIGQQDLTAHVNVTDLERHGNIVGLSTLGVTQQGLFLMALGLGDRLAALSNPATVPDLQTLFQRRAALHGLMNPTGLGKFTVLMQAKGLTEAEQRQPLIGFTPPSRVPGAPPLFPTP
jgi:SAM-dependent MidA family methyltransferase